MKVTLNAPVFLILYVTSIGLILLGALIGCTSEVRSAGVHEMRSERVAREEGGIGTHYLIFRHENAEVVCYTNFGHGISCFPKGAPK